MKFITRPLEPGDLNFVLNSWLLSARRFSPDGGDAYFRRMEPRLKQILAEEECLVVCNSDLPAQVFGWISFDSRFRLVHFVYVKRRFRDMGLAKQLLQATQMDPQYCTTCPGSHNPNVTYIGVI